MPPTTRWSRVGWSRRLRWLAMITETHTSPSTTKATAAMPSVVGSTARASRPSLSNTP